MTNKNLLIEGWRGVNHSFALVNQAQIIELLKLDGLRLFHRDLPFAMAHWNAKTLDAGFPLEDQKNIAALKEPTLEKIDCVYRIASPFRSIDNQKTISFLVTELGLSRNSFLPDSASHPCLTDGDSLIVTPTNWSKARIVDYGFDAERVKVIPHGVNSDTFYPLSAAERLENRTNLGYSPESVVFLNLGVATWNKGIDRLLLAFATLRQKHKNIKLVLKDQRGLYGISVDTLIKQVATENPSLFGADTQSSIQVVPVNLSQGQLRLLYGVADCYVSSYRAEGFNLPVLEAVACGTPVVVTKGGATDDFFSSEIGIQVDSQAGSRVVDQGEAPGKFCEPNMEALVSAMEQFTAPGPLIEPTVFSKGRQTLVDTYTWKQAAQAIYSMV
jgi:glycosyltransferase involved in cell wall biosynthesis